MANPATPHPILNPSGTNRLVTSAATSNGRLVTSATTTSAATRPATLSEQLAAYNISTQTVVGAVAPKLIGAALIWIGQRIFSGIFGNRKS